MQSIVRNDGRYGWLFYIDTLFWSPGRENRLGKKDRYEKVYTGNAEVFADIVNYLLYEGEEKIQPDDLREMDGEELLVEEKKVLQRLRDVVKQVTVRQDEEAIYMIIGLENQTQVHYAMPVRTMVYDAMHYAGQVEEIRKQNGRRWKQRKGNNGDNNGEQAGSRVEDRLLTSAEFLSGITKEDKLLPVITIVILYSSDPWDGPVSLYDMLATKDPEILKYVQDYHIHLIAPGNMTDQQIRCFHSSMRKVLTFIKYAKDKEKMKEIMSEEDSDFYHVDRETAQFIKEMTGVNIEIQEGEEDVNMCKAWEDMAIDMKNEGIQLGEQRGLQLGRQQGEQIGEQRGLQENRFLVIKNMIRRGYSDEDILAIAECEPEDIE